jgi:thiol-disulfide isomerase/thioredoxin
MIRLVATILLLASPAVCFANEEEKPVPAKALVIEVVDSAGQPVSGADVGLGATIVMRKADWASKDALNWKMRRDELRTDESGLATIALPDGEEWRVEEFCLTAQHPERQLAVLAIVDSKQLSKPVRLTLARARVIEGVVASPELAERDIALSGVRVSVLHAGQTVLNYHSGWPKFRFTLPPGDYELQVDGQSDTHAIRQPLHVAAVPGALDVGTIKLPASNLALLIGQTAPEIPGVIAWKNDSPGTIEELRGKVVLLDFWGYWCGACVSTMPKLFELHDKYRDQGLVIMGIHADARYADEPPVNTPAEMDALVAEYRQDLWGGRDIPYSVALVPAEMLKHRGGAVETRALSQASAAYGVWSYPTYVLIDRQGKVAGRLSTELLEKLLAEK